MKRSLPARFAVPIGLSLAAFAAFASVHSTSSKPALAQEDAVVDFVQPVTEVVEIGSGSHAGISWNFEAYQALLVGGSVVGNEATAGNEATVGNEATNPSATVNALCIGFTYPAFDQEPDTFDCFAPIEFDQYSPIGWEASPDNAYFGMTPAVTDEVRLESSSGASSAALYGPFPELGLPVKFYVGFAPTTQEVSITAVDSMGNLLWTH